MHLSQQLSDDELEELDGFFMSDMTPDACMNVSVLDGFLAGVVLTPSLILPNQWLSWVWDMDAGKETPDFKDLEVANHIIAYIMRYYNYVLDSINNGEFQPLLIELLQAETYDASGWCEGFMLCVTRFQEPWRPVLREKHELFEPIVLLGTEAGQDILEESGRGYDASFLNDLHERICEAVPELHDHFLRKQHGKTVPRQLH